MKQTICRLPESETGQLVWEEYDCHSFVSQIGCQSGCISLWDHFLAQWTLFHAIKRGISGVGWKMGNPSVRRRRRPPKCTFEAMSWVSHNGAAKIRCWGTSKAFSWTSPSSEFGWHVKCYCFNVHLQQNLGQTVGIKNFIQILCQNKVCAKTNLVCKDVYIENIYM